MVFGITASSPLSSLSPQQALELACVYLGNACNANDPDIALVLCHDADASLSHAGKAVKRARDKIVIDRIASAYIDLGKLLDCHGRSSEAQASYKKASKFG